MRRSLGDLRGGLFQSCAAGDERGDLIHRVAEGDGSPLRIPRFEDWIKAWHGKEWNAAWYCVDCLAHVWDARPPWFL